MCTAAAYRSTGLFFGRTLDYEFSYGEQVVILPRRFPLSFRMAESKREHYAIIGIAHVVKNDALFYDAVNEKGLAVAGLNFVGNACYHAPKQSCDNIAPFELIAWILSRCASVREARSLISRLNLINEPYSEQLPAAKLHWLLADRSESVVLEPMRCGLQVHDNPVDVLTNNPPFAQQMFALSLYMGLSPQQPENRWSIPLCAYSRGMGALGLPGDLSSQSRFIRAAFTNRNAPHDLSAQESVSQFFHILGAVEQQRGCCEVSKGKYEITIYTSCCDAQRGIYYYTSYNNHQISAVELHREALDADAMICYPLVLTEQIRFQNQAHHTPPFKTQAE